MPRSINCSHCIFANTSPPASGGPFGVLQTGCKTWRLDHYISTGKAERPQVDPETGEVYAFYGLSTKGYENLSHNMAEIKRYIRQVLSIIDYYKESDNKEKASERID